MLMLMLMLGRHGGWGLGFAHIMHSFAGMVHNEDTTWNIDQIPHSLDLMSIFLDSILSA